MPIAYVSSARQTGASVSSFTMTVDVGSGSDRLLVVALLQRSTTLRAVSAITYNGVALAQAGASADNTVPATKLRAEIWYLANPTAGSNTLSVTYTGGTVGQYECQASWYTGVAQTSPLDDTDGASGQSNAPAVSLTPTENNCLLVGGVIHEAANPLSTGADETVIYNNDNGAWVTSSSRAIQTTATTQSVDWSAPTSDYWAAAGAVFKAASANVPPTIAQDTADEATLDDTPTLEFTGTDADNDDIRYNIQISDNADFDGSIRMTDNNSGSAGGTVHPNPMTGTTWLGDPQMDDRPGQSFTAEGGILDSIKVYFGSDVDTDGTARIRVYDHAGVFGTSSAPLNAADPADTPTPGWLAVSDDFPFGLGEGGDWRTLTFSGANRIRMEAGKHYIFILDWIPTDTLYDNTITTRHDSTPLHAGNVYMDGGSEANNGVWTTLDMWFQLYEDGFLLDKVSGTDSGFLNTVNGGDTDPFTSGQKVSFTVQAEDALASAVYYWRVRAIDPSGSNTYSSWSATRSFTVASGTIKTVSDSGAAADSIGSLAVSLALAETGAGVESFSGAASLGLTDSGSGSDLVNILISVLKQIAESGAGSDALGNILASLMISDSGVGVDMPAILAALGLTDSGSGADSIYGISVSLSVTEIGAGSDLVSILSAMLKTVADSGAGADGLAVNVALAVSDLGAGSDAASQVVVTLTVADAGAGADLVNVIGGGLVSILESGAGVDGLSIAVAPLAISDSGSGADSLVIQAVIRLSDTATGADAISVLQTAYKLVSELATGTDAIGTVSVSLAVPESGAGVDLIGQVLAWVILADSGSGVDVAVHFDTAVRIATLTFTIARRTIAFTFASREIEFSLVSREIDFELN